MTQNIFISYNGVQLSPTPLCNFSEDSVKFGYLYGYSSSISLDGYVSGITTTGAAISGITSIFANQFGNLLVQDDQGNTLYNWSGITVNEISLEPSLYYQGSFLKYSIKLTAFGVPSGVLQPSNEYSFNQEENGVVTVNHKISARGVRNNAGAFQNAVSFVNQFVGNDPFSSCAPYFVPGGSGALMSINESINRAEGIYEVNQTYKYDTGLFQPYFTTTTLDIDESLGAEFKSINYNVKYQASPINKNLDSIISAYLGSDNILADISANYGFSTSNWVKTSYTANVDSGAAIVDIKVSYFSGANASGFFDYVITNDQNLIELVENWKIEGEFRCFGPLDYKIQQFKIFKANDDGSQWKNYLTGLITNSPLYSALHDSTKKFTQNNSVQSTENTQLGDIKLSLTLDMGYEPAGIADLKYEIDTVPSRRIYELLPSANIEGSFVIQDLQLFSQPSQTFTLSCNTYNKLSGLQNLQGYMQNLTSVYVNSGNSTGITAFLTESSVSTGTYDVKITQKYLGLDNGISSTLNMLQSIGSDTSAVPVRPTGFSFGY